MYWCNTRGLAPCGWCGHSRPAPAYLPGPRLFVSNGRGCCRRKDPHQHPRFASRAAYSWWRFDAIDVVHIGILNFPVGAGEEGGVNGAAVHQNQNGTRQAAAKAANANGPLIPVDALYFDTGRIAERFGDAGRAGAPDILAGDDVNGDGYAHGGLWFF